MELTLAVAPRLCNHDLEDVLKASGDVLVHSYAADIELSKTKAWSCERLAIHDIRHATTRDYFLGAR